MTISTSLSSLLVAAGLLSVLPATASPAASSGGSVLELSEARCPCVSIAGTDIRRLLVQSALIHDVPPELVLAVAEVESGFKSNVMSVKGACGIMQIMPSTALSEYGIDAEELWTPQTNITIGVMYLKDLYNMYGRRWSPALSHYNGGTLSGDPVSAEPHGYTRGYVSLVLAAQRRYQADPATQGLIEGERTGQLVLAGGPEELALPLDDASPIAPSQPASRKNDRGAPVGVRSAEAAGGPVDLLVPAITRTAKKRTAELAAAVEIDRAQLSPSQRYVTSHFDLKRRFEETLESLERSRHD